MRGFFQDCLQMTGFPGKGDSMYEEFRGIANRLMETVERGSLEEARLAYSDMNDLMDTCHREFK
jgi:XXXCH domain-containing protein